MSCECPLVFGYVDYRRYLADYYAHAKKCHYGFSFRVFSKRAEISSSNYLRLVIDGKRNLTSDMAVRFARACGLSAGRADFFCDLVAYNQAKNSVERNRHFRNLQGYRRFREVRRLEAEQTEYYASWYVPVIRELLRLPDFEEDPKWISTRVWPRISVRQARQALDVLLKLGLIARDEQGRLKQVDPLVTTGPGPLSHHIFNYHHLMLQRAGVALDQASREEREISCITVCVSQDKMLELKRRIDEFRSELLQAAELDNAPERVVQVNFQLFPLSCR